MTKKDLIPEGWYNAECVAAKIIESKKGTRGCKITWAIVEEDGSQGREVSDVLWFTDNSEIRMTWAENAMGLIPGSIKKNDPEEFVSCVAAIRIKEDSWTNREGEKVPCNEIHYEGYDRPRVVEKKAGEKPVPNPEEAFDSAAEEIPF